MNRRSKIVGGVILLLALAGLAIAACPIEPLCPIHGGRGDFVGTQRDIVTGRISCVYRCPGYGHIFVVLEP